MEKTISMNEAIPATFGSFMRVKREEQGMSLRSLARKLEVTATYISDIEIGNRPAPRSRLQDISDILCLDKNGPVRSSRSVPRPTIWEVA